MMVVNGRLNAPVRVARPYKIFGRDRETSSEACAGDVVGLVNPGRFAIGDSLYSGRPVKFPPMPQFAAEHFGRLRLEDQKHKQFDDGVRQLEEEGLMQVFRTKVGRDPVVGVVGALQFDVIQSRLSTEYGAASRVEPLDFVTARWLAPADTKVHALAGLGANVMEVEDRRGRTVLLFPSPWALGYAERHNPTVTFLSEIDR
jgi:peptide chain release factor 3